MEWFRNWFRKWFRKTERKGMQINYNSHGIDYRLEW